LHPCRGPFGPSPASRPAPTPLADFCHAVGGLTTASVSFQRVDLLCLTHGRSPEVRCPAFRASRPD
jgi:hypothetical protein